jgi:hypothetical protein
MYKIGLPSNRKIKREKSKIVGIAKNKITIASVISRILFCNFAG